MLAAYLNIGKGGKHISPSRSRCDSGGR
jgi:hypothetical protein